MTFTDSPVDPWSNSLHNGREADMKEPQPSDCGLFRADCVRVVKDAHESSDFTITDAITGNDRIAIEEANTRLTRIDSLGIPHSAVTTTALEAALYAKYPIDGAGYPLRQPNFQLFFVRYQYPGENGPYPPANVRLGLSWRSYEQYPDPSKAREDEKCPDFDYQSPIGLVFVENCRRLHSKLIAWVRQHVASCSIEKKLKSEYIVNHVMAHELTHQLGLVPEADHSGVGGTCHDDDCHCVMNWINYAELMSYLDTSPTCGQAYTYVIQHMIPLCIGAEHSGKGCSLQELIAIDNSNQ